MADARSDIWFRRPLVSALIRKLDYLVAPQSSDFDDETLQRNRVIALGAFGVMAILLIRAVIEYMDGTEGLPFYFALANALAWPLVILFGLRFSESKGVLINIICGLFILQTGIFYLGSSSQNAGAIFALVVLPMISIVLSGWKSTIWLSLVAIGIALIALWVSTEPIAETAKWSEAEVRQVLLRDVILLITAISMFALLTKWLQRTALKTTESAKLRAEWSEQKTRELLEHQSITLQAAQALQSVNDDELDLRTTEILHLVASLVDAEYVSLTLWDTDYQKLHARYHWRSSNIDRVSTVWQSFSTLYKWSASELRKNTFIAVDNVDDLPFAARAEQDLMKERGVQSWLGAAVSVGDWANGILSVQCHDRQHHWLPDEISSMQLMSGILAGVVARHEASKSIQERDASFSKVFEAHPDGLAIVLPGDGRIIESNRGFCQMTGLGEDKVSAEGKFTDLPWVVTPMDEEESLWEQIHTANEFDDSENLIQVIDREDRQILASGKPIEIGGERCILLSLRNVTRQRELETQLLQAQKMEAVGLLAGGIAHDFNNMLTIISGFSEILYEAVDPELQQDVQSIRDAARRSGALTRQLLAFSRRQVLKPEVINLNQLISEQESLLKPLIGEDVEISLRLDNPIDSVKVDPGQIEQVIMNLATNGRDAMPSGGQITISTQNITIKNEISKEIALPSGQYVCVSVRDSGTGMSNEVIARAFEPFYTTKQRGSGSGLGLSTAHGIIEQSGGALLIESRVGHGTVMRFYLPITFDEAHGAHRISEISPGPNRSETILLVEDESEVRRLARLTLEASGYQVISAENGEDAFQKVKNNIQSIDLVLTDIVMPTMGGIQLVELLKELHPEIKVAMMTGYPGGSPSEGQFVEGDYQIIPKPFKPSELRSMIAHIIDT